MVGILSHRQIHEGKRRPHGAVKAAAAGKIPAGNDPIDGDGYRDGEKTVWVWLMSTYTSSS